MKIKGLDNKLYSWNPVSGSKNIEQTSSYHLLAKKVIKSIYLSEPLLEEVSLPGTKPTLFADFLLPHHRMILEVHGEQHYNWVAHFHPTKKDFLYAKNRDSRKRQWCELNNFFYIELPHWENENEWRCRILSFGETRI